MNGAAEKPQVVVLSSIDWSGAWQRHQIFSAQFAAAGRDVFFVENMGFRNPRLADLPRLRSRLLNIASGKPSGGTNTAPPGVRVISPTVLPPAGGPLNRALLIPALARKLRRAGLRPGALALVYYPTRSVLSLLDALEPSAVVYDCASNFRGHPDAPADIAAVEGALLARADLVVTDSDYLYAQKKAEHPRVVQIHQGVAPRFFEAKPPAPDYKRLCYYGTWIPESDGSILVALAEAGFAVTISGFIKAPTPRHPGITVLPPAPLEGLVRRLESFDAFVMPYRLTEFMRGVVPAKTYETMALGRPVIAVPLPSLAPYRELMYFAGDAPGFVAAARGLPETETPALKRRRAELAREHTHEREFARLTRAIADARAAR